nr:eukaryotic initiation factor 4A-15-like [Tanacetum cinerariifolium]
WGWWQGHGVVARQGEERMAGVEVAGAGMRVGLVGAGATMGRGVEVVAWQGQRGGGVADRGVVMVGQERRRDGGGGRSDDRDGWRGGGGMTGASGWGQEQRRKGVVASVSLADREAHRGPSVVWWQPGGGGSVIVDNFVQDGVIWHGSVLVRFGIIQNKESGSVGYSGVAVGVAVRGGGGGVVRVVVADREAHRGPSVVWWRPGGGGGWPWWPTERPTVGRPWCGAAIFAYSTNVQLLLIILFKMVLYCMVQFCGLWWGGRGGGRPWRRGWGRPCHGDRQGDPPWAVRSVVAARRWGWVALVADRGGPTVVALVMVGMVVRGGGCEPSVLREPIQYVTLDEKLHKLYVQLVTDGSSLGSVEITYTSSRATDNFDTPLVRAMLAKVMADAAAEGSQFDTHQFDSKMNEFLSTNGQDFFTSYDEVTETFDAMGLLENLLRGIYAYALTAMGQQMVGFYTFFIALLDLQIELNPSPVVLKLNITDDGITLSES